MDPVKPGSVNQPRFSFCIHHKVRVNGIEFAGSVSGIQHYAVISPVTFGNAGAGYKSDSGIIFSELRNGIIAVISSAVVLKVRCPYIIGRHVWCILFPPGKWPGENRKTIGPCFSSVGRIFHTNTGSGRSRPPCVTTFTNNGRIMGLQPAGEPPMGSFCTWH